LSYTEGSSPWQICVDGSVGVLGKKGEGGVGVSQAIVPLNERPDKGVLGILLAGRWPVSRKGYKNLGDKRGEIFFPGEHENSVSGISGKRFGSL